MTQSRRAAPILRVDPRNPLPLHAQAEESLRRLIQQPRYRKGGLLPDETTLANALGVSRNTLRTAVGRLVAEGRLERKSGVGTRVTEPRAQGRIGAWHSFTREMEARGVAVETYSTAARLVPATSAAARALKIPEKTEVLCVDRVRGWEGRPEAEFQSFFHPRLRLTTHDNFSRPLYEMMRERSGAMADESLEEFVAVAADRRLGRLLKVAPGTPLLRRERVVLDAGRRPMEYAIVYYRCDRFRLTLNLRQP